MVSSSTKVQVSFNGLLKDVFRLEKQQIDPNNAPNIRTLLESVCSSREARERIFDEHNDIRRNITILKNGRNILFLKGPDTQLGSGDSVALFPPTCGG